MQTPHTNFSPEEAAAFKKVVAAIAGLDSQQVLKIFEHVQGQLADEGDDMPMFARGIAGPLGKLDFPAKTKIDSHTGELFLQYCVLRRTDTSAELRDCIPDRFLDRSLKNFVATTNEQRVALEFAIRYAKQFEEVRSTGRSALFIGLPGTGKTHLACGIGMHVIEHFGADVLFITVQRAIRSVKDTWTKGAAQSETEAVATLVSPDLLILDEVGVQNGTDFERNTLFDVINERYERRKPTLYLSNLPKDEVATYLGARVMDRVREDGGKVVAFTWESHRGKVRL